MEEFVKWGMWGVPLLHTIFECKRGRDAKIRVVRWWITCILVVLFSFSSATLCGMGGFFIAHYFSGSKPASVSTQCRILTSSVDLRSDKVCQPGLLNFKAKNVFLYTGKAPRHRCHYDYYWASVFKVEYKQHASIQPIRAAAEAPKEALPVDCRPDFSSAWRTKDTFKVNGTYRCKYTPGKSKVDIVGDDFFNCFAQEPSVFELIYRHYLLFWRPDRSLSSKRSIFMHFMWNIVAFIFASMSCSILATAFVQIVKVLRFKLFGGHESKKVDDEFFEVRMQLFCIFIALLFFVIWFGGQWEEFSHLYQLLIRAFLEGSHTKKWWNNLQKIPKNLWK